MAIRHDDLSGISIIRIMHWNFLCFEDDDLEATLISPQKGYQVEVPRRGVVTTAAGTLRSSPKILTGSADVFRRIRFRRLISGAV